MSVSSHTQAILLLTAHFSKAQKGELAPLTPTEWGRFAQWLHDKNTKPEKLLSGRLEKHLDGWSDKKIPADRIAGLLQRGAALAFAMEKWLGAGLWVITRSDPDYPKSLKHRLGQNSPALLFGCGNKSLLNQGGLAVIGSRNTTKQDLAYSREIGRLAAKNGSSIISGGARGIDETSMLGALEAQGTVIGILADSLLRACSSKKYRPHLMADNLALISPFYPEAGFNIGNAMARNKYIYCLSDAALVVHSGKKGGTWSGARENIKKQWVLLWVKQTGDKEAGNAALVKEGAEWVSEKIGEIDFALLLAARTVEGNHAGKAKNSETAPHEKKEKKQKEQLPAVEKSQPVDNIVDSLEKARNLKGQKNAAPLDGNPEFYELFLAKIKVLCADSSPTTEQLAKALQLHKTQLNIWLKQAIKDKKLKKLTKPVRYQWLAKEPDLFTLTKKCI